MTTPLSLAEVNRMNPAEFSHAFGAVFEHSAWIAERAFSERPFADVDALHAAMQRAVLSASPAEQLALLRAHPELAGREAREDRLTDDSRREQASVGLNALTPEEMARIAAMNARHAERFGFPFIIAVRVNTKDAIFAEFARRLELDPQAELEACLEQVFKITHIRLHALLSPQA